MITIQTSKETVELVNHSIRMSNYLKERKGWTQEKFAEELAKMVFDKEYKHSEMEEAYNITKR